MDGDRIDRAIAEAARTMTGGEVPLSVRSGVAARIATPTRGVPMGLALRAGVAVAVVTVAAVTVWRADRGRLGVVSEPRVSSSSPASGSLTSAAPRQSGMAPDAAPDAATPLRTPVALSARARRPVKGRPTTKQLLAAVRLEEGAADDGLVDAVILPPLQLLRLIVETAPAVESLAVAGLFIEGISLADTSIEPLPQ